MRTHIAQQFGFGDGFIDPSLYELDEELKGTSKNSVKFSKE